MSKKPVYSHFTPSRRDTYGKRFAIIFSIALHFGAIAGLWLFSHQAKPKPKLLSATPVTLTSNPNRASGKKSKAPVAGRKRQSKSKKTTPSKPKTKKPPAKKSTSDIGLNRDKKPKPDPVRETPKKTVKKPTKDTAKSPPDTPTEPEVDRTIPIAKGGFGGTTDSGISFEMGSPNPNIDVKDYEFASYFRHVHEQVARRWSRGSLTGGIATIRFHIHRDGSISNAEIIHSAGKAYLDNPAKLAVLGAELPPLPQGIREELLIVDINFHYYNPKP